MDFVSTEDILFDDTDAFFAGVFVDVGSGGEEGHWLGDEFLVQSFWGSCEILGWCFHRWEGVFELREECITESVGAVEDGGGDVGFGEALGGSEGVG